MGERTKHDRETCFARIERIPREQTRDESSKTEETMASALLPSRSCFGQYLQNRQIVLSLALFLSSTILSLMSIGADESGLYGIGRCS